MGQSGTARHKIALQAERTNGIYNPEAHHGLHREAPKVDFSILLLTSIG